MLLGPLLEPLSRLVPRLPAAEVVSIHSCPLLLQIALGQMDASSSLLPAPDSPGHRLVRAQKTRPLPQSETDSVGGPMLQSPLGLGGTGSFPGFLLLTPLSPQLCF